MKPWGNVEIPINGENGTNPIVPLFVLEDRERPTSIEWSETKGLYVLGVSVIFSGLPNNVDFVHTESQECL